MIRPLAFVAAFSLLTPLAFAETVTIMGSGGLKCKTWTELRKGPIDDLKFQPQAWVLGYLSAWAVKSGHNLLENTDKDAIFSEIDRKCALKPLEHLADAAADVAEELDK